MKISEFQIHSPEKLDRILVKLCDAVLKGQNMDEPYGMVGAALLDMDNRVVIGLNTPSEDGGRHHAERVAIMNYEEKYGEVPQGSIIITTLSPCNEDDTDMADERYGESCTDLINNSMVRKVYCGYIDPSQHNEDNEYTLEETGDDRIKDICKKYADTFLKDQPMEDASGVIATKKQAKDPRYSMSLTKDVRPGQIEKNLKAFNL
jgi:pyrimidine deaminase RibD-like protein